MNKYLELLPIVADRGWRIRANDGYIRDKDGRGPLCALAHEVKSSANYTASYWKALDEAGFDDLIDCEPIARAADLPSARLRAQLKAALGMKP